VGHSSADINEFWSETLMPIDDGSEIESGRDDEANFDLRARYTSTLEGALEGTCAQYHLSGPQDFELELSFDDQGRLTRQRGRTALSTFRSDHLAVTYHPVHGQISSIFGLDAEGQTTIYGREFDIDDDGVLLSHSSHTQTTNASEDLVVTHREDFLYECR
jgi:hypothetical protein